MLITLIKKMNARDSLKRTRNLFVARCPRCSLEKRSSRNGATDSQGWGKRSLCTKSISWLFLGWTQVRLRRLLSFGRADKTVRRRTNSRSRKLTSQLDSSTRKRWREKEGWQAKRGQ